MTTHVLIKFVKWPTYYFIHALYIQLVFNSNKILIIILMNYEANYCSIKTFLCQGL